MTYKIALIVGTRPNYIKAKPILDKFEEIDTVNPFLIDTGQHSNLEMHDTIYEQIGLRKPDKYLRNKVTKERAFIIDTIKSFFKWCINEKPDCVIVVGDVDSTVAGALGAMNAGIPVIHVEAGLRSFDRAMPEERNRIITDMISSLLLVSEQSGIKNLLVEGRNRQEMVLVGNVMIDTLYKRIKESRKVHLSPIIQRIFDSRTYAVLTMHRPSNVDSFEQLMYWSELLRKICLQIPIIFPMHPRTRSSLSYHDLYKTYCLIPNLYIVEPLGYLQMIKLLDGAKFVMTDSGGITEETSVLKVPCLTIRKNTERPVTITNGTSVLVGQESNLILDNINQIMKNNWKKGRTIMFWDGNAAERVVSAVISFLNQQQN